MRTRDQRQKALRAWAIACFGTSEAINPRQRALRFLEEAVELVQAVGLPESKARELLSFVYGRPPGEVGQEIGGAGVTLALLADSLGFSADREEERETIRVLSKPRSHFTKRNQEKNDAGMKA